MPNKSIVIEDDEVDAAKMYPEEWDAGVDEWLREGNAYEDIPLKRPEWDAVLRRRAA